MTAVMEKYGVRPFHVAALALIVLALALVLPQFATHAQTNTPIPPTATPITLSINTNGLITQVNNWVASLDDVVFISIAFAIAFVILLFVGNAVLKAIREGGVVEAGGKRKRG